MEDEIREGTIALIKEAHKLGKPTSVWYSELADRILFFLHSQGYRKVEPEKDFRLSRNGSSPLDRDAGWR